MHLTFIVGATDIESSSESHTLRVHFGMTEDLDEALVRLRQQCPVPIYLIWAWVTPDKVAAAQHYLGLLQRYKDQRVGEVPGNWFDLLVDQIHEMVPPSQVSPSVNYADTWRKPYLGAVRQLTETPSITQARVMLFDEPIPDDPSERQDLYNELIVHPQFVRWYEQVGLGCDTAYEWTLFCDWWSQRGANVKLFRAWTSWLKSDHCSHNRQVKRHAFSERDAQDIEKAFERLVADGGLEGQNREA